MFRELAEGDDDRLLVVDSGLWQATPFDPCRALALRDSRVAGRSKAVPPPPKHY
jgi:hypothetical protein